VIQYLAPIVLGLLLISNGLTWHYAARGAREALVAFKAETKAKAEAKENENARIQAQTRAAAAAAGVAASIAEGKAWSAEEERAAALVRLGGVVRTLADARRVLSGAGGGAPAYASPVAVRGNAGDTGADPARRLAACEADLTVLTSTMSVNRTNHERALIARNGCVRLYNEARTLNNEEGQ